MSSDISLVTCIAWVKKGYAKRIPKEYELDEEEIELMKQDPTIQKKYYF